MVAKKKLSIILLSGDYDKVFAALTIGTGASALGYEVNIFHTFFGLNVIKQKRGRAWLGKGILAKGFGFLLGGRNNLPLSRLNFAGLSPILLSALAKSRNVAVVDDLFESAKQLGINFYACETAVHILGLKKEEFVPEVKKIIGIGTFLELQEGGQTLFI